jgi:multidrug efflux pump subunit AcrB
MTLLNLVHCVYQCGLHTEWQRKTRMSNEEAANIPPLITIAAIVIAFILLMLYQYRQQINYVATSFKMGVVALLVMLGIIDDK